MLWGHPQTTCPLQIQYKGEKHPCSNVLFHTKILFQYKTWFIKLKDINTYSLYCCYCCSSRQYFDSLSFSKDRWQAKSCQHFPQIPQNHFQKNTIARCSNFLLLQHTEENSLSFDLRQHTAYTFSAKFFIQLERVPNCIRCCNSLASTSLVSKRHAPGPARLFTG